MLKQAEEINQKMTPMSWIIFSNSVGGVSNLQQIVKAIIHSVQHVDEESILQID